MNTAIHTDSIVLIQKNVRIIVEEGGELMFGKHCTLKEGTIIYVKKNANIFMGDGTSTGHHTEISANNSIKIGNDVIMGAYTYVTDSNHGYKDKTLPIKKQSMDIGDVVIGSNVWLGRNVMVLKNSNIGDNSVVGAGAVVTKKFPHNCLLGGLPAKIIKEINVQ